MTTASQLPNSLTVDEVLEINLVDLKSNLTYQGMVVRGFTKCQMQSQLIKSNDTVGREGRDEVASVHSNTKKLPEAVVLKRLEVELKLRRLELAAETPFKEKVLATQT